MQKVESEVQRFDSHGDSEFFLRPTLGIRQKISFSISLLSSKLNISLTLFTKHSLVSYYCTVSLL